MLSGLFSGLKKQKNTSKKQKEFTKDEADIILLVGSETGNTKEIAEAFLSGLLQEGKKVFMDDLDQYTTYEKATQLLILSSTFGDGDAPDNAMNFKQVLHEITPMQTLSFAVLGFGSIIYPNFCQFSIDIDQWLQDHPSFNQLLPLVKVNEQSYPDIRSWLSLYNRTTNADVRVKLPDYKNKRTKSIPFTVLECTALNEDATALIRLQPQKQVKFQSGDLLHIIPEGAERPRLYSVARIDNDVLLSVKQHDNGMCSSYLCNLKVGDELTGTLEKNEGFHFPTNTDAVWMIANGTGIAPFLGMLEDNPSIKRTLTWGGRTNASFDFYKSYVEDALDNKHIHQYELALSRSENGQYVQDLIKKKREEVASFFKEGGVFMLCGSMAMQHAVLKILDEITLEVLDSPLSEFQLNGQLLKDCY
jgi:sulfite reductase (NADPH) flavoprotein alpha-component